MLQAGFFTFVLFCAAPLLAQTAQPQVSETKSVEPVPPPIPTTVQDAPAARDAPTKILIARNKEFPLSVHYDFSRDNLVLQPLEFEYDLTKDNGSTLILGPIVVNESKFNFTLGRLQQLYSAAQADAEVLLIRWPDYLLKSAVLEMISRGGKVLWKHDISVSDVEAWKNQLKAWRSERPSSVGILNPSVKGAPFATVDEPFRFCLTQGQSTKVTRLCSDQHIVRRQPGQLKLARQVLKTPIRVLFQNEEASSKKKVIIRDRSQVILFYADLSSGISYEFASKPPAAQISDIAPTTNPGLFRVVGWDIFPMGNSKVINEENYPDWVKKFGFEPTIKDERQFWEIGLKKENPVLYFPGEGGGVFRQRINIENIPPVLSRIYLRADTPKATYWNSVPLYGRKHSEVKPESKEYSIVDSDPPDPSLFIWNFKAVNKGEINKSYLTTQYKGKNYFGYYDVFRAFANELSGRFTGVYSSGTLMALGELAYNFWLESIFGNPNPYYSFQRWGFSGKVFRSLAPLPINQDGDKGNLDVSVFDFKYRLTPGVWTRDETVGLIASYQTMKFESLATAMVGFGAFWARSMPAVFDRWFNKFPLMNYPKWVDMELIVYTTALTPNVSLGINYALNFHGQVLWSKTLFGEAGFGLKRYSFTNSDRGESAELSTLYGTLGMGIKF
jgi:hypothetical protein